VGKAGKPEGRDAEFWHAVEAELDAERESSDPLLAQTNPTSPPYRDEQKHCHICGLATLTLCSSPKIGAEARRKMPSTSGGSGPNARQSIYDSWQ
jgi:hypothetical protein